MTRFFDAEHGLTRSLPVSITVFDHPVTGFIDNCAYTVQRCRGLMFRIRARIFKRAAVWVSVALN